MGERFANKRLIPTSSGETTRQHPDVIDNERESGQSSDEIHYEPGGEPKLGVTHQDS